LTDPFRLEARYYDKIWGSTVNYVVDVMFLDQLMEKYNVHRVLDLACGTGGHCLELAKLGYDVVGLDISQLMLENAQKKFTNLNVDANFVIGDMITAHSSLKKNNIVLPFDAIICMGNSLAHMIDDTMLAETFSEVRKLLKQNGIFILRVQNAERLRDDKMKKLYVDKIINEPDLQLALLCYNYRDDRNPDILIWNSYWVIRDHGTIDFQVQSHPLRWFRYNTLKDMLETYGFFILHSHGDISMQESFESTEHDTMIIICQKK
jgi:SAM-dependent methyltransferase